MGAHQRTHPRQALGTMTQSKVIETPVGPVVDGNTEKGHFDATAPGVHGSASQQLIGNILIGVSIWVAGACGLIVLAGATVFGRADLLVLATLCLVISVTGVLQRQLPRFNTFHALLVIATGTALVVPFVDRTAHLVTIPAMTFFAFVGIFSLERRRAAWFVSWCALLSMAVLPVLLPDVEVAEMALAMVLLGSLGVAAWRLMRVAADAMASEEENNELMLHTSPVAIMEEDFSEVGKALDELRSRGVTDLTLYLRDRPEEARRLISKVKIRRANPAAVEMIGAASEGQLIADFEKADRVEGELAPFIQQFVAIWEGRRSVALDLAGRTLGGDSLEAVMHWAVPDRMGNPDLSRVIVTFSDIAPRIEVEQRLARALESNRRLLDYEHALASCSRALVLTSGMDGLTAALETLRETIGADRAYLSINFEDPDIGPAFRIVSSANVPGFDFEGWEGQKWSWSDYEEARALLSRGRPYQRVADDDEAVVEGADEEARSVLGVPVFSGGEWVGTVGFVDVDRQTEWTRDAVRMLEVAAPMLGTFWERDVARRRLEDLVRSKDKFIASVSHELRTPLAAVLGFAEELRDNVSGFQVREITEMLELIADQSQEMADMVEDLLVSARAEIGTITIRPQDVYLRSQAEAELAALGAMTENNVRIEGGRGKVWADPTRTRQILRNLITNAIRYGGPTVTIEAFEGETIDGETVTRLTVRDDGAGLDESQWESIFEPYVRAHDTPTQPASIGLGLTVSRQLARLMRGDLVYRADSTGSVFELSLPTEPGSQQEEVEPKTMTSEAAGPPSARFESNGNGISGSGPFGLQDHPARSDTAQVEDRP
ncbi:MAG: GAF domain-containing protein [Actinobacteria bacterium]|nr:MAG: GAF domain-containing protein [Actinomycetota bacterium]